MKYFMKFVFAVFCLMYTFSAVAGDGPTAKIECKGLTTVGEPVDPGYSVENRGISDFSVSAVISNINKCDGTLNCWLIGDSAMSFASISGNQILLRVVAVQEKVNGPIRVSSIVAKLVRADKILAVNKSSGDEITVINPEPYQILRDSGQPTMGIYEGYEKGLLKGSLLSEVNVSCSVKN